jgi:chromosome segregation ATPase
MHRDQILLQPALRTVTRVQKVDISALANRRNRSFYLFEGLGINSQLHADRARLTVELEHARQDADRQRADHAAELEQVRDELDRTRQDAGLWREETDRERARIANLQADSEHTEREMAQLRAELTRLRAELKQARRPWWRRLWEPEP